MRQKIVAMLMAVAICATCVGGFGIESRAEDTSGNAENYSVFTAVDALVGYTENQTRGIYLASGYSVINKISSTKVGAGGITYAALKCKVSVNAILEKLSGSSWVRVTSWTTTVQSGFSAVVDESKTVSTGYYYRVRCIHTASSDGSTSYTNNLWM